MPVRKQMTRIKRINERIISELKELIRRGTPWNVDDKFRANVGLAELRGLVTGLFYLHSSEQSGAIKKQKSNYTKPFEMSLCRRMRITGQGCALGLVEVGCTGVPPVVGRDLNEDDEADCFDDRLPAAEDPTCRSGQKENPTLESRLSMTDMFTRMNTVTCSD